MLDAFVILRTGRRAAFTNCWSFWGSKIIRCFWRVDDFDSQPLGQNVIGNPKNWATGMVSPTEMGKEEQANRCCQQKPIDLDWNPKPGIVHGSTMPNKNIKKNSDATNENLATYIQMLCQTWGETETLTLDGGFCNFNVCVYYCIYTHTYNYIYTYIYMYIYICIYIYLFT